VRRGVGGGGGAAVGWAGADDAERRLESVQG
jgi:hypothetical protein